MPPIDHPLRLGHTHLQVRALDRSIDFYRHLFGLAVTERLGDALAFLTSSDRHHDLALQALGESAPPAPPGSVGLYHVAFEAPSAAALERALERLDEQGSPWQAVDHGISWAVYFTDPDGNGLELYLDRRALPGGRREWRGVTSPLARERIRQAAVAEVSSSRVEPDHPGPAAPPPAAREQSPSPEPGTDRSGAARSA